MMSYPIVKHWSETCFLPIPQWIAYSQTDGLPFCNAKGLLEGSIFTPDPKQMEMVI